MTIQWRVVLATGVVVVALSFCMPFWFSATQSPYPAYIMVIAAFLLLILFVGGRSNGRH